MAQGKAGYVKYPPPGGLAGEVLTKLSTEDWDMVWSTPSGGAGSLNVSALGSSNNVNTLVFGNANGVTFGLDGSTITASVNAAGGGLTNINVSAGTTSLNLSKLTFADSNGLAFGLSGNSVITGSYSQSTHDHPFVGLNTALTGNGVSWTVNTSGISLNVPAFLTTARGSTDAVGLNTAKTNVTWTVNSSGISIDAGGYAGTGFTSTSTAGSDIKATHNTAGLSMAVPAFLTTARGSTDAIGLNTAQSNVTWTVNSSGLSLDARGYAGTGTTFAGANISGSLTQNSNGLNLSLSVAAPGAAAENNAINLLGANTAGNTTATGSTIGWSGINLTFSGTNNSQVVVSAPATSSLVGTSGISISTNGSTISVQPVPMSNFYRLGAEISQAGVQQANSLVSIVPFLVPWPVVFSNVRIAASINVATAANNSSAYIDLSFSGVLYSRNGSTLSSITSFSNSMTQTWNSNATGTVTGIPAITATLPAVTLTPGMYWLAIHVSTANSATGGAATTALGNSLSMILAESMGSAQILMKQWGAQTNNSQQLLSGMGMISTGATRASIAFSDYTVTGTRGVNANLYFGLRNETYQG